MEQITVTKYKAKDGTIFDAMGDATARDRIIDRTNRVKGIVDALRPDMQNAFHYGLLVDGNSDNRRATIILKLAEMIDDNFDKITKSRMESVKGPTTGT